jgi:probable rRNA maturation factor
VIERPRVGGRRLIGGEGEVEVFVSNEQDAIAIDEVRWRDLALSVLGAEGVRGHAEMAIMFVEEAAIATLNAEFMDAAGPTDVLAFPIDGDIVVSNADDPHRRGPTRPELDLSELPLLLGDVIICPTIAAGNAPEHAGTLDDEIALLVVHGTLHLLGYDHAEPDERGAMRKTELVHLAAYHWVGPPPPGFRQDQPG